MQLTSLEVMLLYIYAYIAVNVLIVRAIRARLTYCFDSNVERLAAIPLAVMWPLFIALVLTALPLIGITKLTRRSVAYVINRAKQD